MFLYWLSFLLDLFPFLPFWWLLAFGWVILWLKNLKGKLNLGLGILQFALLLLSPLLWLYRPKASLLCLGLIFLIFWFSFPVLFFKQLRKTLSPGFQPVYAGQKLIVLLAVLGALLITVVYRQPEVLVARLGIYPSVPAEKWLTKNNPRTINALINGLKPGREAVIFRVLSKISAQSRLPLTAQTGILTYLNQQNGSLTREAVIYAAALLKNLKITEGLNFLLAELKKLPPGEDLIFPQLIEALKALPPQAVKTGLKKELFAAPESSGQLLRAFAQLGGRLSEKEITLLRQNPAPQLRLK